MKKDMFALLSGGKFVELSKKKRIYKKQLIAFGAYVDPSYPKESMILDQDLAERMVANFRRGLIRVATPTIHTVDSSKNAGELIDLMIEQDGLYGLIEIRREEIAEDIDNGLIFDVSVSFEWNFQDTRTGEYLGETLTHVALVNDPYIPKMKPFEAVKEVAKAFSSANMQPVMLSRSKGDTTMLVENTRKFDVTIKLTEDGEEVEKLIKAGEGLEVAEDQADAVRQQIEDATAPESEDESSEGDGGEDDSDDEADTDGDADGGDEGSDDDSDDEEEESEDDSEEEDEDKGGEDLSREGKTDLSKQNAELSRENAELHRKLADKEIEQEYQDRLAAGKIVPAMKESFVELSQEVRASVSLSNGSSLAEKFQAFLDSTPKIVSLSQEEGSEGSSDEGNDEGDQADSDAPTSISLSSVIDQEGQEEGK